MKEGAVQIGKWRACQAERSIKCKGPEASACLVCSRNEMESSDKG